MSSSAGAALREQHEDLPPVAGRHRNRVLAARRREAAVRLVTEGHTYQQVADTLGYRNRGSVHHIVKLALQSRAAEAVQEHRETAYARLEALLAAVWDEATGGDLQAVRQALSIVTAEMRLLGLEPPSAGPIASRSSNCGPWTVVVSPNDCRHQGCPAHGIFER